jgi:2-oxoglutarate ferredoxin oxidoreductase subunit delta
MAQVAAKPKKAVGGVIIMAERCKGCGFCVELCPPEVLELSNQYNAKGYHPPILVNKDGCTGCDICGMVCPDFAIYGFIMKKKVKEAK